MSLSAGGQGSGYKQACPPPAALLALLSFWSWSLWLLFAQFCSPSLGTGKGRCLWGINSRLRRFSLTGGLTLGALGTELCFLTKAKGMVAARVGIFLREHLGLVPQSVV